MIGKSKMERSGCAKIPSAMPVSQVMLRVGYTLLSGHPADLPGLANGLVPHSEHHLVMTDAMDNFILDTEIEVVGK